MSPTRHVIGDIHGCSKALRTLIETIDPGSGDEIIFLGDYIDRGPDSRNVIDQLMSLSQVTSTIFLRGNHEVMLLAVACGASQEIWLRSGGNATLASYGGSLSRLPSAHVDFFNQTRRHHETDCELFVHAMYDPVVAMDQQGDALTYWTHLPRPLPGPHQSGKRVHVGHTPQPGGNVLLTNHLIGLDTYCFGGGYLTAMNLDTGELIQADRSGHLRRVPIVRMMSAAKGFRQWLLRAAVRR